MIVANWFKFQASGSSFFFGIMAAKSEPEQAADADMGVKGEERRNPEAGFQSTKASTRGGSQRQQLHCSGTGPL